MLDGFNRIIRRGVAADGGRAAGSAPDDRLTSDVRSDAEARARSAESKAVEAERDAAGARQASELAHRHQARLEAVVTAVRRALSLLEADLAAAAGRTADEAERCERLEQASEELHRSALRARLIADASAQLADGEAPDAEDREEIVTLAATPPPVTVVSKDHMGMEWSSLLASILDEDTGDDKGKAGAETSEAPTRQTSP